MEHVGLLRMHIKETVMASSVKDIIGNPQKYFDKPREVILDSFLTNKEKEKVLDNWELEERALLEADEENMPKQRGKDDKADVYLQEISKTKILLKKKRELEVNGL